MSLLVTRPFQAASPPTGPARPGRPQASVFPFGGTDNAKIISYLHSGVALTSVQGPVKFDALGENGAAAAFVFQWQKNNFNQVLPVGGPRSDPIITTKPAWSS